MRRKLLSVSAIVAFGDSQYNDFHQKFRGGQNGMSPVGTLHATATATGDGTGGNVLLLLQMKRVEFGFRAVFVPTLLVTEDDLATPEAVRLQFSSGNKRLSSDMNQAALAVASSVFNVAQFDESGLLLESDVLTAVTVMAFVWSTNTNLKVYTANVFAAVFDMELIEKYGSVSDFLAGVR